MFKNIQCHKQTIGLDTAPKSQKRLLNAEVEYIMWQSLGEYWWLPRDENWVQDGTCRATGSMKQSWESAVSWFYYKKYHGCPRMTFCCMCDYNIVNQIYSYIIFVKKKIMRNWRSKVTAGVTETKMNLADCELSVKRAFHWFQNMFHFSSVVVQLW